MEKCKSANKVTVRGTINMSMLEKSRERTELCGCNVLFKYGGVLSITALKESEAVLDSIHL